MFAGIIFDMDGVLADTHPIHRRAWREFLYEQGRSVSEKELDYIEEGHKLKEMMIHFLGPLSPSELSAHGERKRQLFYMADAEVRTFPGVVALLRELRGVGIPTAVATSASRVRAHTLLAKLGLEQYFRFIVTGDDVDLGKPDPAIFSRAAQLMDVAPESCLVIEDSSAGVQAANAAGMTCLGIATGERASALLRAGAARIVADLSGLSLQRLHDLFTTSQVKNSPNYKPVTSESTSSRTEVS
jgi:HAD superfamily hydrolase (TIGR01509 family)